MANDCPWYKSGRCVPPRVSENGWTVRVFRCLCLCLVWAILAAPCWAAKRMYSAAVPGLVNALAVDPQGNAYIASTVIPGGEPVTPGAFQTHSPAAGVLCPNRFYCLTVFVAKLDPGGEIVWATYLGGSQGDYANSIAVDSVGNVLVAGLTGSPDFPTTTSVGSATTRTFVAKLSRNGSSLIYSFLFDGLLPAGGSPCMAIDAGGSAYVAGAADPASLAATPGAFQAQPGGPEGYVGKINQAGAGWEYLTYIGNSISGNAADTPTGLAINAQGEAYVAGVTTSVNLAGAARGAQSVLIGAMDLFVAKLNASGSAMLWSTYAGSGDQAGSSATVALDASGGVYLAAAGYASSSPTLYRISPDGSAFVYSKSLPANELSRPNLAVDSASNVYVGGGVGLSYVSVTPGALDSANYFGTGAGYIQEYDATGSKLLFGSYFFDGGGYTNGQSVQGIGLDSQGNLYIAGASDVVGVVLTEPPLPWLGPVLNAASLGASRVVPGELVTLKGAGLGPDDSIVAQAVDGRLPTQLGGVEVLVNGVAAPLLYVSGGQINAIVPLGVSTPAKFVVKAQDLSSNAVEVPVETGAPAPTETGIFTSDTTGQGQAAALNQDGTINSPANPAPRGSIVTVWLTGAGSSSPPQIAGTITPWDSRASLAVPLAVALGSALEPAEVLYSGVAPGLPAGVAQVNFRIPADAQAGPAVPLFISPYSPVMELQSVTIATK